MDLTNTTECGVRHSATRAGSMARMTISSETTGGTLGSTAKFVRPTSPPSQPTFCQACKVDYSLTCIVASCKIPGTVKTPPNAASGLMPALGHICPMSLRGGPPIGGLGFKGLGF